MLIGEWSHHSSTWCTFNESLHDKIWFIYLFECASVFADGSGNGAYAHWSAFKFIDDGKQYLIVYLVETILVDIQSR